MLNHFFSQLKQCPAERIRILLLDREDLWLERLFCEKASRPFLESSVSEKDFVTDLSPLATTLEEREFSFQTAAEAFAKKLGKPFVRSVSPDLSKAFYDRVLLIHMRALLSVYKAKPVNNESAIVAQVLLREQEYLQKQASARGIGKEFFPAIQEALAQLSRLKDGEITLLRAERLLRKTPLLADQSKAIVRQTALLLRECYPSHLGGIATLQPDLLKEFLDEHQNIKIIWSGKKFPPA